MRVSSGGSFLQGHGRNFPQTDVVVVHHEGEPDEERHQSRCVLSGERGSFNTDAPVYEGDWVEVPDPRQGSGGIRRLYVRSVQIYDAPSPGPFSRLNHLEAKWGTPPRPHVSLPTTTTNYNGPVITVNGGTPQIAWGSGTIAQSHHGDQQVTSGFEDLARAVTEALRLLQDGLTDDDEKAVAQEAADVVLSEVVKTEPDSSLLRRGLTSLKGLLAPIAVQTATAVGSVVAADSAQVAQDLIHRLTVGG